MLTTVPFSIALAFILTTVLTLVLFIPAVKESAYAHKAGLITWLLLVWTLIHGLIAWNLFFTDTSAIPPLLMVTGPLPMILLIIFLFLNKSGRRFIDSLPLERLTLVHIVRIPVEIILYLLFVHKAVPELMTFEGRNFDILAGISAPVVVFLFVRNKVGRGYLLGWNIVCLLLLINIVVHAVLSTPFPLQQFAFDQPNIAVLYFPFNWLTSVIVPIVLFSHLAAIRQLRREAS